MRVFELPRLKKECFHTSVVCLDVRSETAVSTGPKIYGRPEEGDEEERLFAADPRKGMVVVDLEAGRRLFHVRGCVSPDYEELRGYPSLTLTSLPTRQAHFLRSSLIDQLDRALAKPPTFLRRSSWAHWGSTYCHFAEAAVERACVNFSHGFRVVVSEPIPPTAATEADPNPSPAAADRRWIVLSDFNPLRLASAPTTTRPDDGEVDNHSWTLHDFPTVVAPGDVFRTPVESRLPRRTRVLGGDEGKGMPCEAVMVDEERLIVCSPATEVRPSSPSPSHLVLSTDMLLAAARHQTEPRTFHIMAM